MLQERELNTWISDLRLHQHHIFKACDFSPRILGSGILRVWGIVALCRVNDSAQDSLREAICRSNYRLHEMCDVGCYHGTIYYGLDAPHASRFLKIHKK